jgi:hypothetical protein
MASIVPLGRGYFSHDSRHFVPGYYHAVPSGTKTISNLSNRLTIRKIPLALYRPVN